MGAKDTVCFATHANKFKRLVDFDAVMGLRKATREKVELHAKHCEELLESLAVAADDAAPSSSDDSQEFDVCDELPDIDTVEMPESGTQALHANWRSSPSADEPSLVVHRERSRLHARMRLHHEMSRHDDSVHHT